MYADFYSKRLKNAQVTKKLVTGLCPFHDDSTPSFSAYVDSGKWACFGSCNLKDMSAEEFLSRLDGISLQSAIDIIEKEVGNGPRKVAPARQERAEESKEVPAESVEAAHEALLRNTEVLTAVTNKRLWSLDAIKQYKIGWAADGRIWFPVKHGDKYVDVRRYDWEHKYTAKFIAFASGYARTRLWPHVPEPDEEVLLLEGEPDCLLARSLGLNAYTSTGGAGNPARFSARKVTILFDADKPGEQGAEKTAALLRKSCGEVVILKLPTWEGMPHNADFTDWVKSASGDVGWLVEALGAKEARAYPRVSLAESTNAAHFNKTLLVAATVSGKLLSPFQVPKRGRVVCPANQKMCARCGIEGSAGNHIYEVNPDSPKLIECSDEPDNKKRAVLREHLGIPKACTLCEMEDLEIQNLYGVHLTSLVDMSKDDGTSPYLASQAWSTKPLDINTPLLLTARAMPDPKTQQGTLIITDVRSDRASVDDFSMTPAQMEELRFFQP